MPYVLELNSLTYDFPATGRSALREAQSANSLRGSIATRGAYVFLIRQQSTGNFDPFRVEDAGRDAPL